MAGTLTSIRLVSGDVEQDPSSAGAGNRDQGSGTGGLKTEVVWLAAGSAMQSGSRSASTKLRNKCRSFDSAEERFAQDDRPFRGFRRKSTDGIPGFEWVLRRLGAFAGSNPSRSV